MPVGQVTTWVACVFAARGTSGPVTICTPAKAFALAAVAAFVAFVAWVAFVAFVALVAESAFVACAAFGTMRPLVLILAAVTAPFLIFGAVTAFLFSCLVP